ncbi:hypothetical protein [Gynuella sunshinyii]|uniref:Uncharacterized protein n=1 Tax=Gynuella sunshinyii YC6258 TaxID=1445510 RepID=A0A0C5W5F8_9GAMM|nr:hypothetical protein [Gynuella sunshinyii]AJQ97829.1 hypothetical Protein YC6258_05801 [Gynuella sunshinyii YC6258]
MKAQNPLEKASTQQAQKMVKQGDELLQHSLSLFAIEPFQPVKMAFPNVIGQPEKAVSAINAQKIYEQQQKLFNSSEPLINDDPDPQQPVQVDANILSMYK